MCIKNNKATLWIKTDHGRVVGTYGGFGSRTRFPSSKREFFSKVVSSLWRELAINYQNHQSDLVIKPSKKTRHVKGLVPIVCWVRL